jgi:hypothetical protein
MHSFQGAYLWLYLYHFPHALLLNPEDGGSTFLSDTSKLHPDYIVSYRRKEYSSNIHLFTFILPYSPHFVRKIDV